MVSAHIPDRVILDVADRNLVVHRDLVELRRDRPGSFSLVTRSASDRNPALGTPADLGRTYAVCPWSRSRVRLTGRPDHLECPDCGHTGVVDWDSPC